MNKTTEKAGKRGGLGKSEIRICEVQFLNARLQSLRGKEPRFAGSLTCKCHFGFYSKMELLK